MSETPRLLLLDGHSLAYRAFFALPVENFSTQTGQPTNAVFGFTSMLINMLRDERPTHIIVSFDVSRQSFRTRALRRIQGRPVRDAQAVPGAGQPRQRGARGAAHPGRRDARLRGRRRDRHADHPGPRGGHGGGDQHRRPRRVPARRRARHRALPGARRLRGLADDPRGRRDQILRPALAIPRQGRAGRRDQRQPAGRSGRRRQDRGQVDQGVRRSRRHHRQRRQDQGQGGGEPARPPRRRDAQLRDQQAGVRPRAVPATRGRALGGVGP